jgi:hypothetical protein
MNDKGLTIWLMIVFGAAGLALLVCAWTMPYLASARLLATIGGVIGVGIAAVRGLSVFHSRRLPPEAPAIVEVRTSGQ